MKNLQKKHIIILIIFLIILALALILFLIIKGKHVNPTAPEVAGPPTIQLVDKDTILYNSVTYTNYLAIKDCIAAYITNQGGDPINAKVIVSDIKTPFRETSILSFKASIPSINQDNLLIEINYEDSTFNIKEKNYTQPLYGIGD